MTAAPLAFATPEFSRAGQGVVLVVRPAGKVRVELATFVVDVQCLGVRKISFSELPQAALSRALEALRVAPVELGVALGIVAGAAAFAKKAGFAAPANIAAGLAFFGDAAAAAVPFDFGVEGKPFYSQQAGDDGDFVESVLEQLEEKFGPDGFGFQLDEMGEELVDDEGGSDDAEAPAEEE